MLTVEGFRKAIPALTEALVTDEQVEFYLRFAAKSLNKARWDDLYEEGAYFFAAHYLTLDLEAAKSKDGTGGVSKSESRAGSAAAAYAEAGDYNDTSFGKRYWRLVQLVGAGGTVV